MPIKESLPVYPFLQSLAPTSLPPAWICPFWTFHMSRIIQYDVFWTGFQSSSSFQGISMFKHVSVLHSFIWQNNIPLREYTIQQLACSHFLAAKNIADSGICVQVFVWYIFSLLLRVCQPGGELLGHTETI